MGRRHAVLPLDRAARPRCGRRARPVPAPAPAPIGQRIRVRQGKDMHRDERENVLSFEQGAPLSQLEGPIHQLYLCGWEPRVDLGSGRTFGSQFSSIYKGGDRPCPDFACRCEENRLAATPDYQRTYPIQIKCLRPRVRTSCHLVQNAHPRNASTPRYPGR